MLRRISVKEEHHPWLPCSQLSKELKRYRRRPHQQLVVLDDERQPSVHLSPSTVEDVLLTECHVRLRERWQVRAAALRVLCIDRQAQRPERQPRQPRQWLGVPRDDSNEVCAPATTCFFVSERRT